MTDTITAAEFQRRYGRAAAEEPAAPAATQPPAPPPARATRYRSRLEAAYATHLAELQAGGAVAHWHYECVRFRLADGCWYKPDFAVIYADGAVDIVEVKGFSRNMRESRVRWLSCAEHCPFPWMRFVWVTRVRGEWRTERYGA